MNSRWIRSIKSVLLRDARGADVDRHRKILDEFRSRRSRYENFCVAVHNVLDTFLREGGYKYQIAFRTKTLEKLREKLVRKDAQGRRYASLEEIEDLAGLRVVFYSERDKQRFLDEIGNEISGSIRIEEKTKRSGYNATHLIVSFGPTRVFPRKSGPSIISEPESMAVL